MDFIISRTCTPLTRVTEESRELVCISLTKNQGPSVKIRQIDGNLTDIKVTNKQKFNTAYLLE